MSKRAVVTGGFRHLGFHVAQSALQAGFEVELLVTVRNTNIDRLAAAGAHFTVVDFNERASFRRHLEWADVLFHAGVTEESESERLLNTAVAAGVPRIVFTSAAAVLGQNHNPHHLLSEDDRNSSDTAEQVCDRLIRDHGADLRRVYPSWWLSPDENRGSHSQNLIRTHLRNEQRFWFRGGVSVSGVEEAGRAHVSAALAGERCGVYVLGGENISVRELYSQLSSLSGRPMPKLQVPARIVGAFPRPFTSSTLCSLAGTYNWYDSSKAVRELGYSIRPAQEVLEAEVLTERKRAAGTNALFSRISTRQVLRASTDGWNDAPILLTGVPGWLGNRFIEILLTGDRTGFKYPQRKVHLLVQPHQQKLFDLPESFKIFPADLSRRCDLTAALAGVRTVFHLQAATNPRRVETFYRVNRDATRNLADECIRTGVRRLLYVSTDAVCWGSSQRVFDENTPPAPLDDYGQSKWLAEEYLRDRHRGGFLEVTILREFWAFGPFAPARQERFLASLRRRRQFVFGDGKKLRSVSHIDNTINALLAAERSPESIGKSYWIGDEKYDYTVDEINTLLCDGMGQTYHPVYVPQGICSAARAADRVLTRFDRFHPAIQSIANSSRDRAGRIDAAQRDFGYRPVISLADYAKELAKRGRPEPATRRASAG